MNILVHAQKYANDAIKQLQEKFLLQRFILLSFYYWRPTYSVRGKLVTVTGVCRRLSSSSVTLAYAM